MGCVCVGLGRRTRGCWASTSAPASRSSCGCGALAATTTSSPTRRCSTPCCTSSATTTAGRTTRSSTSSGTNFARNAKNLFPRVSLEQDKGLMVQAGD
uniref:Uncharacterized protein n=1 Tax=Arundo donax TaxID=35708 RepID=A0A0A9A070_ARUDO